MTSLQNLVEALPQILVDDERLASFAHDLGHSLRTVDDEVLRELRNLLAAATVEDGHRSGIVSGVLEVIDGYRSSVATARGEAEALAELRQGLSRDVVAELAQRSATTSELARALGKSEPEISRALGRLRKLDLVDSTRDLLNRRVRPHRLSLQGRTLADRAGLVSQVDTRRTAELRALISRPIEQVQFPSAGHRTLYSVALHVVADLLTRSWTADDRVTADAMAALLAWQPDALRARARAERHVVWTLVDSALRIVGGEALAHRDAQFENSFRVLLAELPGGSMLRLLWAVAAAKLRTPTLRGELAAYADGVLSGFDLPVAWFWRSEVAHGANDRFLQNCRDARPSLASGLPDELERNLALTKEHTCYTWSVNLMWAPFEDRLDAAARRIYGGAEASDLVDRATADPPTIEQIVAAERGVVSAAAAFLGWMKAHPPKRLSTAANDQILQEYVFHACSVVRCAGGPEPVAPGELFAQPTWRPEPLSKEALLVQMGTQREGPGVSCLRVAERQAA